MKYVWDSRKNSRNVALHGLAFEDAIRIFEGPTLERVDQRFDYPEVRIYAIGVVNGIEITVIYTELSETEQRIISAWRSTRNEREAYWENVG
jgi:uncharacterized protein